MALNKKQREWARRVYSGSGILRCHFPVYTEEKGWVYCGATSETTNIHIHHITPARYFSYTYGTSPDFPRNLIALCVKHHVGRGHRGSIDWRNEPVYVVHPDIAWAFQHYAKLKQEAFKRVFEGRNEIVGNGGKYWNTDFDKALQAIADYLVGKYIADHPEDKYPF